MTDKERAIKLLNEYDRSEAEDRDDCLVVIESDSGVIEEIVKLAIVGKKHAEELGEL